jgi:Flp pilus assembly protein TadG
MKGRFAEDSAGSWTIRRRRLINLVRREDGQALAELVLVLPVLLMILFGIFDFGRAVNYWNDENHLAEMGARYASVGVLPSSDPSCGSSEGTLAAYITCEAGVDSPELKNGDASCNGTVSSPNVGNTGVCAYQTNGTGGASVCVSVPNNSAGQEVTVEVAANYNFLPFKLLGNFATTQLTGTATMRLEQPIPSGWITTSGACA